MTAMRKCCDHVPDKKQLKDPRGGGGQWRSQRPQMCERAA